VAGSCPSVPAHTLRPLAPCLAHSTPACGSLVRGDPHAGFCESRGVRFPPATHLRLGPPAPAVGRPPDQDVLAWTDGRRVAEVCKFGTHPRSPGTASDIVSFKLSCQHMPVHCLSLAPPSERHDVPPTPRCRRSETPCNLRIVPILRLLCCAVLDSFFVVERLRPPGVNHVSGSSRRCGPPKSR